MNDNNDEIVKTIDTEIDYVANDLYCYGNGDVNNDESTNVTDVVLILGHILETYIIDDLIMLCEADVNEDNVVNVVDIVILVELILNS